MNVRLFRGGWRYRFRAHVFRNATLSNVEEYSKIIVVYPSRVFFCPWFFYNYGNQSESLLSSFFVGHVGVGPFSYFFNHLECHFMVLDMSFFLTKAWCRKNQFPCQQEKFHLPAGKVSPELGELGCFLLWLPTLDAKVFRKSSIHTWWGLILGSQIH